MIVLPKQEIGIATYLKVLTTREKISHPGNNEYLYTRRTFQ